MRRATQPKAPFAVPLFILGPNLVRVRDRGTDLEASAECRCRNGSATLRRIMFTSRMRKLGSHDRGAWPWRRRYC